MFSFEVILFFLAALLVISCVIGIAFKASTLTLYFFLTCLTIVMIFLSVSDSFDIPDFNLKSIFKAKNKSLTPDESEDIILEGLRLEEQLNYLNGHIKNKEVNQCIASIINTHRSIFEYVENYPDSYQMVRKYMKYYVPSIIEMSEHYAQIEGDSFSGTNAVNNRQKIAELLNTADKAFKKLLDTLLEEQSVDISTEVKVLENLMHSDGLLDSNKVLKLK